MKQNRLGCLSPSAVIAALVTVMVIVGIALFGGGWGMFSAGALNAQPGEPLGGVRSHAEIKDCSACHAAPWSPNQMSDRCAICHISILVQMKDVAALHGSMYHNNPSLSCSHCHPDHRGADAPLTLIQPGQFPHETLGYSLAGHQAKVTGEAFVCSDCHGDNLVKFDQMTCITCHEQMDATFMSAHQALWGTDCLACHDGVDTYGKKFDHNNVAFKLSGKHAPVNCEQCHQAERDKAALQATPQDCHSCHAKDDPHTGQFGTNCGTCHVVDGWTPAKFDHNLSAFKLEGRHQEVPCERCHVNNVFKGTPTDCYSCHQKDDEHNGQFGTDCSACHTPNTWDAATFDHNKTKFPLSGAHANVQCEQCHKNGQFAGTPATCVSCHAEPASHAGLFGTDCASCHSVVAWKPASFNGQHTFPLNHGEENAATNCATCHPVSYSQYTCYGCHEHNEAEIRAKHLEEGIANFQNCVECHANGTEHGSEGGGND